MLRSRIHQIVMVDKAKNVNWKHIEATNADLTRGGPVHTDTTNADVASKPLHSPYVLNGLNV